MNVYVAPVPTPKRRRWRWGRLPLIAVCAAGIVAVVVIATVHPWWDNPTYAPTFTLKSISVTFEGTGASDVLATAVCVDVCPATVSVGQKETAPFTVTPESTVTCGGTVSYSVSKVTESTTGGAFPISKVTAGTNMSALPVTIPSRSGPECITTAEILVTFLVTDAGASTQSAALVASVSRM